MTCTCCTTPNAGPRCRCWPITCPDGSRLVLAGRAEPPLRIARLRAEGRILEIGAGDLSLTAEEASSLLREPGCTLGLRMTWLSCTGGPRGGRPGCTSRRCTCGKAARCRARRSPFGGDDRFVSEYMESEFLARISSSAAGVPDPDRGAGADVRAAVRGGAGPARVRRGAGGSGPVEPAAGAAGPARAVVPLPPPVPRHAAGGGWSAGSPA